MQNGHWMAPKNAQIDPAVRIRTGEDILAFLKMRGESESPPEQGFLSGAVKSADAVLSFDSIVCLSCWSETAKPNADCGTSTECRFI